MNTRIRDWNAAHGQLLLPPRLLAEKTFRQADVPAVRRFATGYGARAGMAGARLSDFSLAVSEAAACAVCHGPCTARLRLWTRRARVYCEVHGNGALLDGPGGVRQGEAETLRRWLLKQLCDHADVDYGPSGVTVRFAMSVA